MKRFSLMLFSVAIAVTGFFTGCSEDDEPLTPPVISFANNVTETTVDLAVTDEYEINGTITSEAGLESVQIFKVTAAGKDQVGTTVAKFDDKNSYVLKQTITGITEETTIEVSATDKEAQTTARNFVIKVTVPPPPDPVLNFYTATAAAQLGAQDNTTLGSSYASSTNAVYKAADAKTNSSLVDFIYYYSSTATTKAEFISPKYAADNGNVISANTWSVKNETKLKDVSSTVSAAQFDAIVDTDDAPVVSAVADMTAQQVKDLAIGDVVAFQTAAGKKGLAKVTALATGATGTITFEVKVQK